MGAGKLGIRRRAGLSRRGAGHGPGDLARPGSAADEDFAQGPEQLLGQERQGQLGLQRLQGRQVYLGQAAVGQGDIDLYKVVEAPQREALTQAAAGLLVPGLAQPDLALVFGQGPPSGGDGAEVAPDQLLRLGCSCNGGYGGGN